MRTPGARFQPAIPGNGSLRVRSKAVPTSLVTRTTPRHRGTGLSRFQAAQLAHDPLRLLRRAPGRGARQRRVQSEKPRRAPISMRGRLSR